MRRLLCSVLALVVCSSVAFTTPASAAASPRESYFCPDGGPGDCYYGGDEFCGDPPNPDHVWCGAAGWECSDGSWDIDCVWAEEDMECPDVCAIE